MILDVLENAHRYLALNNGFAKAFEFLMRPELNKLPVGKHEIDVDRIYAVVDKNPGRKRKDALLETHEKYIDIQLVLAGTEKMGWKPKSLCKQPSQEYDQETDVQFFSDDPDTSLSVKPGTFAIFFPEDAHMPLISLGQIHKVIAKVEVNES